MANLIQHVLVTVFLVLVDKYVDDFFGCDPACLLYSGGKCMSILTKLLGLDCDENKSDDDRITMDILGSTTEIHVASKTVSVSVTEKKAKKWRQELNACMAGSHCEPEVAQKKAGQLSSIVSVTKERHGRAYIRPFYQQVYMPLDGNFISVHLRRAMEWWHDYLVLRPKT